MNPQEQVFVEATRTWIDSFVIALNLCPFAKKPFVEDRIRFVVKNATRPEEILEEIWSQISILEKNSVEIISNTFLILPAATSDFQEFYDIVSLAEDLLLAQDKTGQFQIIAFHPGFHFQGTKPVAVGNRVNQSPYPMVHILREKEVTAAIKAYGDVKNIPVRNRKLLEEGGHGLFPG